jgi:hypothetical protein
VATIRELERGIWLDDSVPEEFRHDAEMLCHLLANCVADLVVALSMFEQAQLEQHLEFERERGGEARREQWQRDANRTREIEAAMEAEAGVSWGAPDYFERSNEIREQARRQALREKWAKDGCPETYRRRVVFIHARSFVTTLAVLQRSLIAMSKFAFSEETRQALQRACDEFAQALPGLKGVRDSVAHVEERVRGEARGRKIDTKPIMNSMIHAPGGGVIVTEALNNQHFGGTIEDGTYAEVEVADATTEVARAAVQAVFDALPWRPGHRRFEPSS